MAMILKFYGNNLKISGPLHSVPLEWFSPVPVTYSKKLLRVVDDKSFQRHLLWKSFVVSVTGLLVLAQGIQVCFNKTADPLKTVILPWMLIIILATCLTYHHVCITKPAEIAELINGFIQFDKMYPNTERKLVDLPILRIFGKVFAIGISVSQVVFPIVVVFGLHLNDPWKASLAGYWIIPKPSNQSGILAQSITFGIRIIVLAYNYWFWNFLVAPMAVVLGLLFNVCTLTLLDCIDV